ncbi:MAG: CDGSH iron-sulfur domain-containing protein [Anaerolineae bacterium]|nr:CDGSH iron-sulfur domain-containing protein [Anaerolineae bacterium]
MTKLAKRYRGEDIDVTFEARRCIHVAECLRGAPKVFDTSRRPWIDPANGAADEVAAVVMRCPSGALQFERKDGGAAEESTEETVIWTPARSPLFIRGYFTLEVPGEEEPLYETRATLCRCGASENKPFCDNQHRKTGFSADGELGENQARVVAGEAARLHIIPMANGPLRLRGDFRLVGGHGRAVYTGNRALLCRCGQSQNKPFCDSSHEAVKFQAAGQ